MKKALLRLFALSMVLSILIKDASAQTYCVPSASNPCTAAAGNPTINGFTLNTLNNPSNCSGTNYEDFYSPTTYPALQTTLATGTPYNFTVLRGHADYASAYAVAIWIDLNEDGVFADPGERLASTSPTPACNGNILNPYCFNVTHTGTITVPNGTTPGTKRLRVRLIYSGSSIDPCASVSYGEAEDYRVIITGSVPVTDVTIGTITPVTYCAGDAISIPFTTTGTFASGNIFKAQLSNASGSFASPDTLGSLLATSSGTINGTIPSNAAFGTGYKIRIISTNPADTSSNNSVALTINDLKPVSVSIGANPSGSVCAGSNVTFTAIPTNGGSSPTYQWKVNGNNVGQNSPTFSTTSLNNNDSVKVILTSNATCATGSPTFSSTIIMSVGSSFIAGTVTATTNPICAGMQTTLKASGNSGPIQWRSSTDGTTFTNINGGTDTIYLASPMQTTYYEVSGGNGNCIGTSNILQLVVNPAPTPPVITTSDTLICSNDSTQVCVSGGIFSGYSWNNGGSSSCTYAKGAGGVWVTVTDANSCTASSNHINISVYSVSSVSIIRSGDTLSTFGGTSYQWIKNGVDISGATSPLFVATGPGQYAVRITDANGCISTSANVNITVGIDEVYFDKDISVFPNPASGQFSIQYSGNKPTQFQLTLFNMMGESIKDEAVIFNSNGVQSINIHGLSAGVYMLQMQSGSNRITRRIIVE